TLACAARPSVFVALQVIVLPLVSALMVVVSQPDEVAMPDTGSATVHVTVTVPVYQPFAPAVPDTCGTIEGGDVSAFATWVAGFAAVAKTNGTSRPQPSDTAARTNALRVQPFSRTGRCTTGCRDLCGPTRWLRAPGGADPAPRRRPVRAPADQFPADETSRAVRRPSE